MSLGPLTLAHGETSPIPQHAWPELEAVREKTALTQERLGERAELDPTYISGVERGVGNPSVLSLLRLAKTLEVPVAELPEEVS